MNLENERNYQRLMEVLDSLELTEGNRKLAEEYLDMSKEENQALLSKAEHQDFSNIKSHTEANEYVDHLYKRKRLEELGRYVRFAAAVGGSTAQSVMNYWREYLSPEQQLALNAERLACSRYINRFHMKNLFDAGSENPQALLGALDVCWKKEGGTSLLLAAVYLNCTPPAAEKKGLQDLLKGLFPQKGAEKPAGVMRAVGIVESVLKNNFNELLGGGVSPKELQGLEDFVENSVPGAPMPGQVLAICNGKQASAYQMSLLAGCAFLSVGHTAKALAFLRIAMAVDMKLAVGACFAVSTPQWFTENIALLEKHMEVSRIPEYMRWCLQLAPRTDYVRAALARIAGKYPDRVKSLAPTLSTEEYGILMEQVKEGNKALYMELRGSNNVLYRERIVRELTAWCNSQASKDLQRYLLGEVELEAVLPYSEDWQDRSWYSGSAQRLLGLRDSGERQLYQRALVMEALRMHGAFFCNNNIRKGKDNKEGSYWCGHTRENMQDLLALFEEERLPMHYQLLAFEGMHSFAYNENQKQKDIELCVQVLAEKKDSAGEDFVREAKEGSAFVRLICVKVLDEFAAEYKEALLACAADSSAQVRDALAGIYAGHRDWEPEVKGLLLSKRSQERELAVMVLKRWGAGSYREEFEKALETEKSKKIKALLCEALGMAGDESADGGSGTGTAQGPEQLAADILKGGRKRKVAWAYETPFSEVHKTDGTVAGEEFLQAILVAYADMGTPGVSKDAAALAACLDPSELSVYMEELFGKWLESGAEAKKKWVLYAASIHGREKMVPVLYRQIQEWPERARGAMAAEAVKALALNGSADALIMVDQIARKFKFRQVKAAAGEALSYAAEQLGISRAELEDRIVPNLGFDERMEQVFDYGERSFRVYLNPSLELEIYDGDGKKLKNLPAPGKRDDEQKAQEASDAFKLMKKQLKTVVSNQKLRLEQAMSVERLWTVEKWQELFVKNPVMHQFAIGLIWGLYEENSLKATFRYMEDGSFNTVDEDEYVLPEEGHIGLVHPIELDEESLSAWREQLKDYEVTQPIEQLDRPVYRLTEEEKGKKELTRFGGKLLNGLSLSGKLLGMGWYRGSVLDAGGYYNFYREDGELGVELEFSGAFVGDENDEVTVYEAVFYRTDTVERKSYRDDRVKDEHCLKLDEVKPRYFSETIIQLAKATASSKEQLPYPQCKENN